MVINGGATQVDRRANFEVVSLEVMADKYAERRRRGEKVDGVRLTACNDYLDCMQ